MTTTRSAKATAVPIRQSHKTEAEHTERDRLLAVVRKLGPLIREHSEATERTRRLAPAVLAALADAGVFRLLLPRSLGGLEVDPVTCSLISEEIASFDSAAAWALQAGNTGAWWAARLPKEGVEEIYGENPSALQAAAFHPPQQARETAAGYSITGRGPLASTIHDSEWLFLSALIMDGDAPRMTDGMPHLIGLVLRAREVEVVDTWYSLGMRGTDSNDVVIRNVVVPASRTFPLIPPFEPNIHYQGPLYRFPGIAAVSLTVAPVILAVARNAITELRELAMKKTAFGFQRMLRERPAIQATLAKSEGMLRSARLLYYDTLASAWERTLAGTPHSLEQKADLLLAAANAAATASEVTDMMHRAAGTTGIYARNPLERHFRDAQTLRHHGFLSESRFEAVGQVYFGVPPEFPMVAF